MQNGGWYDNPATGRNQRWWNGTWTDGEEPGQGSSQAKGSQIDVQEQINKYADLIINQAKGDYDYAAKWVESQYKLALGSDDPATQQFLKSVANTMEEKVGRIVYDYTTQKYRNEQDTKIATDLTTQNRELALKRLAEDEQTTKLDYYRQNDQERQAQDEQLNQRGIYSTTRGNADGLAGREVDTLETEIGDRMSALERAVGRNREDTNLTANRSLAEIGLASQRAGEDLTTGARRSAIDEGKAREQQLEEAKRKLERAKEQAEAQRRSSSYNWAAMQDLEKQKYV